MWRWLEDVAADRLYYSQRYDGASTTLRDRSYLQDTYSYKVGSARLRQVRVKPGEALHPRLIFIEFPFEAHYPRL